MVEKFRLSPQNIGMLNPNSIVNCFGKTEAIQASSNGISIGWKEKFLHADLICIRWCCAGIEAGPQKMLS